MLHTTWKVSSSCGNTCGKWKVIKIDDDLTDIFISSRVQRRRQTNYLVGSHFLIIVIASFGPGYISIDLILDLKVEWWQKEFKYIFITFPSLYLIIMLHSYDPFPLLRDFIYGRHFKLIKDKTIYLFLILRWVETFSFLSAFSVWRRPSSPSCGGRLLFRFDFVRTCTVLFNCQCRTKPVFKVVVLHAGRKLSLSLGPKFKCIEIKREPIL